MNKILFMHRRRFSSVILKTNIQLCIYLWTRVIFFSASSTAPRAETPRTRTGGRGSCPAYIVWPSRGHNWSGRNSREAGQHWVGSSDEEKGLWEPIVVKPLKKEHLSKGLRCSCSIMHSGKYTVWKRYFFRGGIGISKFLDIWFFHLVKEFIDNNIAKLS